MDGWKTILSIWECLFSEAMLVSGRVDPRSIDGLGRVLFLNFYDRHVVHKSWRVFVIFHKGVFKTLPFFLNLPGYLGIIKRNFMNAYGRYVYMYILIYYINQGMSPIFNLRTWSCCWRSKRKLHVKRPKTRCGFRERKQRFTSDATLGFQIPGPNDFFSRYLKDYGMWSDATILFPRCDKTNYMTYLIHSGWYLVDERLW